MLRSDHMRWLLSLCFALTLCAAETARRAPGFALPDVNLQYHDLQDYRGKVVVVDFIQTTCPHCQQLTGVLEKLKAKYAGRLVVLSVVNPPDNQTTVRNYMGTYKVTSPMLFDCGQMTASYLRVTPENPRINLPHVTIVDGTGMIRHDLEYKETNKAQFEEAGLTAMLEGVMGAAAKTKK